MLHCSWCAPYAYRERSGIGCGGADKWTIIPVAPYPGHNSWWDHGSGNLFCNGGFYCPNTTTRLVQTTLVAMQSTLSAITHFGNQALETHKDPILDSAPDKTCIVRQTRLCISSEEASSLLSGRSHFLTHLPMVQSQIKFVDMIQV